MCVLYENVNFFLSLLHITQPINTYTDPVCPDRLTLRYCSCSLPAAQASRAESNIRKYMIDVKLDGRQ